MIPELPKTWKGRVLLLLVCLVVVYIEHQHHKELDRIKAERRAQQEAQGKTGYQIVHEFMMKRW